MKKFLSLFFLLLPFFFSFAQTKEEITSALNIFSKKVAYQNPQSFEIANYAELAYLKRNFDLPYLILNDTLFIKKLNAYYYKRYYPYSKLLDSNAIVTEDCLSDESNDQVNKANKLLFYIIYPNSIKMPANIVDQLEEYATIDEFFGPFLMLQDIYFLKKFNYNALSAGQKTKLVSLENSLSQALYTKYVVAKPWEFYKFLSVKVLMMNENPLVKDVDINDLVKYFNGNGALELGPEDTKKTTLLKQLGYKKMMQYEINALLWIFLLEVKKN